MAIQVALVLLLLLGFVGLGVEMTQIFTKHRQMQAAADGGALAGAQALAAGNADGIDLEARAIAGRDGFVSGVDEAVVTVNHPPTSGRNAGDGGAVQVIVFQPQHPALARLFAPGAWGLSAQATALLSTGYRYCILALDPAAASAVLVDNNAILTNPECGVAANSSSASALRLEENSGVHGPVSVHGDVSLGNNASLTNSSVIRQGPVIDDPYADRQIGAPPACTGQAGSGAGTRNLNPGHFCTGWNWGNNAVVNLSPGTYYIDTRFTLGNKVTINGMGGVTLVINGTYAINLGNGAYFNLTAPNSGNYAGLAFFGPRNSTAAVIQNFANNALLNVTGAIYFPSQTVQFRNNSVTTATQCTQVVAMRIHVSNNVDFDNKCAGTGVEPLGGGVQLVE